MIKSNWPIKNLIMLLDLIFMQNHLIWPWICIFFSIFGHNGVQLGIEFPPKIIAWFFPIFVVLLDLLSPHCQPLFYFLIFILKKKLIFWGITQDWVMTVLMDPLSIIRLVLWPRVSPRFMALILKTRSVLWCVMLLFGLFYPLQSVPDGLYIN